MTDEPSITDDSLALWISRLRGGDQAATERLWRVYFERMVLLARRKLRGASTTVRNEEDVALSAFKSFCLGIRQGRFPDNQGTINLWPLLVSLTINKSVDQLRYQNRLKRRGLPDASSHRASEPVLTDDLLSTEPTAESVAVAAETMDRLLDRLDRTGDPELKSIALASIEGESVTEIAKEMNCSARTVQRKLKTIRAVWETHDQ